MMMDANTKQLSGYSYDLTQIITDKLGLKVEWVEETGWGTAEQGLGRRYDMVCADVCIDGQRTRAATYSIPIQHNPIYAVVRQDDTRFDEDISKLNTPQYKIAVMPAAIQDSIFKDLFPQAKQIDTTDFQGDVDLHMMVATGKVDATFSTMHSVKLYNKNNPHNQVKIIGDPARYCHSAFMLPLGDFNFKHMIDSTLLELIGSGQLRRIVSKYLPDDPHYWREPAMPYREK